MKFYISIPWRFNDEKWQEEKINEVIEALKYKFGDDNEFFYWSHTFDNDNRDSIEALEKGIKYIKECDKVVALYSYACYDDDDSSVSSLEVATAEKLYPNKFISSHRLDLYLDEYHAYKKCRKIIKSKSLIHDIEEAGSDLYCYVSINGHEYPIRELIADKTKLKLIFNIKD